MTQQPLLHLEEVGTVGPTIVFLPGVGGTTRYWKSRVAPLGNRYRLLLVDLLGFGRSPKPWRPRYTVERHAVELHRVLGGRTKLTLVGHSFGAILAVAYAARHPEHVDRLVLLSLPHFGGEASALRYFGGLSGPDRWLMTNVVLAAVTCLVTRRVLRRILPRLLTGMPREVVEDLTAHTWRSSTSTIWEAVYRHDVAMDIPGLRPDLPVLLIHGDQDRTAPVERVRELVQQHPTWILRVQEGVDHHPLLRRPDACIAAIGAFVAAAAPDAIALA